MRVLIAGGSGFIGQRLTAIMLAKGWEVHLLSRNVESESAQKLAGLGARLVEGDLTRVDSINEIFSRLNPSHYFHNAGWYELGIPASRREQMWLTNVQGLENALNAAEQVGVEKIVMTSSTTALGDTGGQVVDETFRRQAEPTSWYEHTLYEAHQVARKKMEAGLPLVMGSPAQVIGPGDHAAFGIMLRLFLRGLLPPTLWAPEGAFSFALVDDVAAGLVRIMEAGRIGENYFLAGSIMTNSEMLDFWKETTGRTLPILWLPRPLAELTGQIVAPLLRIVKQPAFISPEVVRSSYVSFRYSDDKVRRELGVSLRSAEAAWKETIVGESR